MALAAGNQRPRGWLSGSLGNRNRLVVACYYRALQMAPASLVAPIDKLSVVFAIVLAVIFLGEAVNLKLIIGGTLMIAGALVLAF